MSVIRCGLLAVSLCTLPVAAADWRVAVTWADGIAFVDAASVVRSGDKVAFRMDQRLAVPLGDGTETLPQQVDADCVSRSWAGKSTSKKGKVREEMTLTTVASRGTVYDAVLTAACTGEFQSETVADRGRHAAAFFAARAQEEPVPAAEETHTFESASPRFSLQKPEGWRFVPLHEAKKNRAELRVGDEELQKSFDERDAFFDRNAVMQLVTIQKHKAPFGGLNPTFQVSVRPLEPELPDPSPQKVIEEMALALQKGFPDTVIESPVREFELAGQKAADYVATYTIRTKDGRVAPTRSRVIVVVGGKFIFFIAMASSPGDDPSGDFAKILSSISFAQ